ncbi:MAG TPA: LysE family transporter [Desulfomonilaceae bacterium]|nr:LysE family transporter [Desulfomonilaceae bacterium]
MEHTIFFTGLFVGLFMCAPVGPIGLLCVNRTLTQGRARGLASVLGASTADAVYCIIAGFGITLISNFIEQKQLWLELVGGLILVLLGVKVFFSHPAIQAPENKRTSLMGHYTSAFALMLANPFPILVLTAAFTALGVTRWQGNFAATVILVGGVFVGSATWAPILVGIANLFKPQLDSHQLRVISKFAGALIALFGATLGLATLVG